MVILTKHPKKSYLCQFLFTILLLILLKLTVCSEISNFSESTQSELENDEHISKRPEGAVSLPIKKQFLDPFKAEVVIDKYMTKDGKKVKVILKRKDRPVFRWYRRWRNKQKIKKKAKEKYKRQRKLGCNKLNIFKRFKRGKKDSKENEESNIEAVSSVKGEESVSKSSIFEENSDDEFNRDDTALSKTVKSSDNGYIDTFGAASSDNRDSIDDDTDSATPKSSNPEYEISSL
ncbi:putative signal peptide-containing secreted protein [Cryptosporidium canis]|uniref:Signal peptide-containing secreted protein n=1 Tax=Cryptosporidium canis TaxID=195482 RepID=A0ABQ8PB85_9CRYT|nr:putative signal peptide-containing secreted protein [Cryptosporidium canis]KAJ1615100.1 putative signal peptide-containing secreted protein [Cryptosporidium canis]